MNLNELKHIYFIGIGGIGMSALARYFYLSGMRVSGYDKTETKLTKSLAEEGIQISYEDEIKFIPSEIDLVVYTPAIPKDHKQFNHLKEMKVPVLKRSEMLGEISKDKFTIAIAGTHGKTTITSLVAHIFVTAGIQCSAFIGGILKNYGTNFIGVPDAQVMIVEADEYDRSFLKLNPDIALVSSVDADHLDIYHSKNHLVDSFKTFANQVKKGGSLVKNSKIDIGLISKACFTYSLEEAADFYAEDVKIEDASYHFSVRTIDDVLKNLTFSIPGNHNLENVIAAISASKLYGIENKFIEAALKSYEGVERRFETILKQDECVYIDDYAHHPEELKACINAARLFYPNQKITGIFQPHLYTRTRDFADDFARSLELLDELILLEIYPAREQAIEGINATFLLNKVNLKKKHLFTNDEILDFVSRKKIEVLLTLGAGNIDKLVQPIKEKLINEANL
jgi:UDP-N-acetylmuramate--alanine ligase